MGANVKCRVVLGVVAAGAVLALATAAEVRAAEPAAGKALVVAYNAGQGGAIDVMAVPAAGLRETLARDLKPADAGAVKAIRAGRVKFELRLTGKGLGRLYERPIRVEAGHAYCAFAGGPQGLELADATDRLLHDPSPAKVCRQLATGDSAQ